MEDDFEIRRRKLLECMTDRAMKKGENVITKPICFMDYGIEEFLRKLDRFEEESLNSQLEFKCHYSNAA